MRKPEPLAEQTVRRPTLEATNNSRIDAAGATIPGDLPFAFAKADNNSVIEAPGITVTRKEDGTFLVQPSGQEVIKQFPGPDRELIWLSNPELVKKAKDMASDLRQLNKDFERESLDQDGRPLDRERAIMVARKYGNIYDDKFAKEALAIASTIMSKTGSIEGISLSSSVGMGVSVVLSGKFAGYKPAAGAADFLDAISDKLK